MISSIRTCCSLLRHTSIPEVTYLYKFYLRPPKGTFRCVYCGTVYSIIYILPLIGPWRHTTHFPLPTRREAEFLSFHSFSSSTFTFSVHPSLCIHLFLHVCCPFVVTTLGYPYHTHFSRFLFHLYEFVHWLGNYSAPSPNVLLTYLLRDSLPTPPLTQNVPKTFRFSSKCCSNTLPDR